MVFFCLVLRHNPKPNFAMRNVTDRLNFETAEVETVNSDFTQLYDKSAALMMQIAENPTAMKLFWWLISHMDKRNAMVVSQPTLAEELKCTVRTIQTAVADLRKHKVMTILKSGNTNIYVVNADIAWKDSAENKKNAQFDATVYLSSSEQETQYRTQLMGHAIKKEPSTRQRQRQLDKVVGIGGSAAMLAISIFSFAQLLT